jgi:DNA-binding IclR family transcriptional regulator
MRIIPEDQPSQTLAKGLRVLEVFSTGKAQWGIREIARELDLNPATVMRLVTTLQNTGYLEKDLNTQRYMLGPMLVKMGNLYAHHNPLPNIAQRVFENYADRFDYNFYLGVLKRFELVYLAVLDGRGPIQVVVEPGGSTSLHSTALGKVLLAAQDDDYIQAFLDANHLIAHTSRSIVDPAELWNQIRTIRIEGHGLNVGEQFDDVGAVGAPVHNNQGKVIAGISLAYPRHLLDSKRLDLDELIVLVKEMASEISEHYAAPTS